MGHCSSFFIPEQPIGWSATDTTDITGANPCGPLKVNLARERDRIWGVPLLLSTFWVRLPLSSFSQLPPPQEEGLSSLTLSKPGYLPVVAVAGCTLWCCNICISLEAHGALEQPNRNEPSKWKEFWTGPSNRNFCPCWFGYFFKKKLYCRLLWRMCPKQKNN